MPISHDSSNRLDLRSAEVQEILTTPPSWIVRWGITLIFMFTALLLIMSFIISYPDFITAKVIVTTEEPTERVVARYSGALDKIFIQNGDTVKIGQRLAIIRNTANTEDVYYLKSIIDTLSPRSDGFVFPMALTYNLELGEIETAFINFEKSYMEYSFLNELDPYSNRLSLNRQSVVEIQSQLLDQMSQKRLMEQEFELKESDFARHEALFKKGVISQQEYESKKLEFLQIKKNINEMAISISRMRNEIANANQSLKETKINQKEDDTRFLINLSQSFNTLKKTILDWEYSYVLSSSINGVVSFQEFWGTNQYINSGEVVFSILPTNRAKLVGKLTIPSQNAGKVTIGQKTLVKLDNFPYQQYGTLLGSVRNISISPDNEGNYFVYISLPNGTMTSYNIQLPLDQELIGNAEIITEDLSIAERIFYKLKDILK